MIDHLWKTLEQVNDWIRVSEGKATILLSIQSVVIALLSEDRLGSSSPLSTSSLVLATIAILLNALSMLFSFLCLNPRLSLRGGRSPLFFLSIASFNNSSEFHDFYLEKMSGQDALERELCGQIFVNSEIAKRKFSNAATAIYAFFAAMIFWFIFILMRIVHEG